MLTVIETMLRDKFPNINLRFCGGCDVLTFEIPKLIVTKLNHNDFIEP